MSHVWTDWDRVMATNNDKNMKVRSYWFLLLTFTLDLICSKHFRQPFGLQGTLDVKQRIRRVRDRPAHIDQICWRSVIREPNTLDEKWKREHPPPDPFSRNGCESVFPLHVNQLSKCVEKIGQPEWTLDVSEACYIGRARSPLYRIGINANSTMFVTFM